MGKEAQAWRDSAVGGFGPCSQGVPHSAGALPALESEGAAVGLEGGDMGSLNTVIYVLLIILVVVVILSLLGVLGG